MRHLRELQLSKDERGRVLLPRGAVCGRRQGTVGTWGHSEPQAHPGRFPGNADPGAGRGRGSLPVQLSLFSHCLFWCKMR